MPVTFLALLHSSLPHPMDHDLYRKEQGRPTIYIAIVAEKNGSIKIRCLNPSAIGPQAHARGRKRAFSHTKSSISLPASKLSLASLPKKTKLLMFWPKRLEQQILPPSKDFSNYNVIDDPSQYSLPLLHLLPFKIIHRVLTLLDPASVLHLGQTSRSLYGLCHNNHVWSSLFWQDFYTVQRSPDFERLYQDRKELDRRWKDGNAEAYYLDDTDGHHDSIYSLAWLDHRRILSTSRDRTIKVWDIFTRQCIATETSSHQGSILCVAAASSGEYAVTGSSDGSCVVWSVKQKNACKELQQYTKHHAQSVVSAVFIPNEMVVVTASRDTTLCVWNVLTGDTLHVLGGHIAAVNVVKILDGGRRIVSGSGDGTVRIWCAETGKCLQTLEGKIGGISCLEVVVERERTIWAGGILNNQIQVWSLAAEVRTMTTHSGHTDLIRSLNTAEDRVVTVGYDKVIKVWDARTGKCAVNFQSGHKGRILTVLMRRTTIISAGQDKRIMVLDFGHGLSPDLSN